jgi:VanZ family protein
MQKHTRKLSVLNNISGKFFTVSSAIWAAIILILTLTPGEYVPSTTLFSYDKLGHGGIFFIQALLLMYSFYKAGSLSMKGSMWWGFGLTILYGLVIEFIQNLIPGRGMDVIDALANTSGSFLAIVVFYILNRKKNTESM